MRVLRWQVRAAADRLADAKPGPGEALHALLAWERDAIVKVAEEWGEIDRSHRKLAHRGSRLGVVHVSESSVLRVLDAAGLRLPAAPARQPRPARPWPEWAELVAGVIYIYDFTHFAAAKRCAVAVLDVVSRYWLSTVDESPPPGILRNATTEAHEPPHPYKSAVHRRLRLIFRLSVKAGT